MAFADSYTEEYNREKGWGLDFPSSTRPSTTSSARAWPAVGGCGPFIYKNPDSQNEDDMYKISPGAKFQRVRDTDRPDPYEKSFRSSCNCDNCQKYRKRNGLIPLPDREFAEKCYKTMEESEKVLWNTPEVDKKEIDKKDPINNYNNNLQKCYYNKK